MIDIARLELALDRVHATLSLADFGELPKLVSEMEGLLADLRGVADTVTATRLAQKAMRNGQCLQAAARGLRSAQRRMTEMSGGSIAQSTYTRRGQRTALGHGPGTLTQRL